MPPNAKNLRATWDSATTPPRFATSTPCDAALDHSRPDRVRALAQDPPGYLAEPLGSPPSSSAGQAVWCHYALIIETTLDRSHQAIPPSVPKQHATRARQEIALADRCVTAEGDTTNPDGWAELAHQATALRHEALRDRLTRMAANQHFLVGQQTTRLGSASLPSAPSRGGPVKRNSW